MGTSLELLRPDHLPQGSIRAAIFDFDGTFSTLRCGWEKVMRKMMLELISGGKAYDKSLEYKVDTYIDASTGIHTWCFYDPVILELFRSREVRALGNEWYKHPAFAQYDFAEGVQYINAAVDEFFLSLGYRHDRENCRYEIVEPNNERVALFAHQGMGLYFFSSMLDIPYPEFSTHFDFGHSSMSVINFEQKGKYVYPKVLQTSNDAHLYRDGLMSGYGNIWKF